jgi:DNA replication protein DnaC
MSYHTFQHYIFSENLSSGPTLNHQDNPEIMLRNLQNQLQSRQLASPPILLTSSTLAILNTPPLPIDPWIPSRKFSNLLIAFDSTILNQFACAACAFCGRLMYPEKCEWMPYNENFSYPLLQAYPEKQPESLLTFHTRLPIRIAICPSCKKPATRYIYPFLHPIPNEIQTIPLNKRMYLSPVFMHCSLGRSLGNNSIYTEYKALTGTMNFSKNMRSLILYSGMVGAYLEDNSVENSNNFWLDSTLITAANWLKQNNPFLKHYSRLLDLPGSDTANPFPSAFHLSDDDTAPPFLSNDIVVPNVNFNVEIHNEDYHYSHLMAGFVRTPDNTLLPLATDDPDLEGLLFPDLFPNGKGYYHNIDHNSNTNDIIREETYSKYIKQRTLNIDSRFRLNHKWLAWSYLQLEKMRNHQNNQRIWRQNQADRVYRPPTAAQIIQQSAYSNRPIINESITTTLPTFIRTGDTYFHEKELHVNTMISSYGLPSLFITLTMAESHWTHLHKILKATDNYNTIPTNRPLHTTLHFIHRLQKLKKFVWKNPEHSRWDKINHFFERVEFQNRGAAHTHGIYWTSKTIEQMIAENLIRSDLPDQITEPDLYEKVKANQIHTCNSKCGGPAAPGHVCKKNFPRPFSPITYYDNDSQRYIYRCVKPEDQWVVPYHPETLMIWNAHMNIQYVSSRKLAFYLTKYIAKAEPSHVFNIKEGDKFREHVMARRLGSMELMFLILGETICNSSCTVSYLTTDPPNSRQKAIRPIYLINEDDSDPYWKNTIEKYFNRPEEEEFNNITYPDYFRNYEIYTTRPRTIRYIYTDKLGNYIVKRITSKLVRFRYLKLQDGEIYFYQKLLLEIPCRSEEELLGNFQTYREHWLHHHPELHETFQQITQEYIRSQQLKLDSQFNQILDILLNNLQSIIPASVSELINMQLHSLRINPPIFSQCNALSLPEDQLQVLSTIRNILGPNHQKNKYPYFFITGSAGTGKSFILNLITEDLKQKRSNYLLLAPTGVAATNIRGETIHSALRLHESLGGFQSLAFHDYEFFKFLKTIDTLIIDEISMVSSKLFSFISDMFSIIQQSTIAFGGLNVIVVGDLAQLPPVTGLPVYKSSEWKLFYPLFLRQSQRQHQDAQYYNMLQEIRLGKISLTTWNLLYEKANSFNHQQSLDTLLNITSIVGYKQTADQINRTICNMLPVNEDKFLISSAIDFINEQQCDSNDYQKLFKQKTNFPKYLHLQQGARVMYLKNNLMDQNICNGTVGVVVDINPIDLEVRVAFSVIGGIVDIGIRRETISFMIDGKPSSRCQFPLQNAFALTVHKTQGLTLPEVSLCLDTQIFAAGQAYVALSRCSDWSKVHIASLHPSAFITDKSMIEEYERLEQKAAIPLPLS